MRLLLADDGAPTQRSGHTARQVSTPLRHLERSFEDNGVAGQQVLDLPALEDYVFQWCLSVQPDPTPLQRSNRGKCAHLLRDLDAASDLAPQRPLLVLQPLDLTHHLVV